MAPISRPSAGDVRRGGTPLRIHVTAQHNLVHLLGQRDVREAGVAERRPDRRAGVHVRQRVIGRGGKHDAGNDWVEAKRVSADLAQAQPRRSVARIAALVVKKVTAGHHDTLIVSSCTRAGAPQHYGRRPSTTMSGVSLPVLTS